MALSITRTDLTAAELRTEACRVKDGSQARRCLAIAAVLEGQSRSDAARMAGMDRQTLRDWVHRYNADGVAGLHDRPRPGRPARMSAAQLADLDTIVEEGPDVAKDGVVRWRCADLKAVVAERFGVTLSEGSIGRVLRTRGFRRISPRPRHPRGDEAAQEAFKKRLPKP